MSGNSQQPGSITFDDRSTNAKIIARLDIIIDLLRTIAKQQAKVDDAEDQPIALGPFLGDNGVTYYMRSSSEESED